MIPGLLGSASGARYPGATLGTAAKLGGESASVASRGAEARRRTWADVRLHRQTREHDGREGDGGRNRARSEVWHLYCASVCVPSVCRSTPLS